MQTLKNFEFVLNWIVSFEAVTLALVSTFWDGTKKLCLRHHRQVFVGKKFNIT